MMVMLLTSTSESSSAFAIATYTGTLSAGPCVNDFISYVQSDVLHQTWPLYPVVLPTML